MSSPPSQFTESAPRIKLTTPVYCNNAKGHQEAFESFKDYMVQKERKLNLQKPKAENGLLSGVTCYVNGYLGETITALKLNKLINTNGGNTTPYLRKNIVTHVICTNLAGTKVQQILDLKKTSRIQIVKPEWILDSIAQGMKLSTSNYHVMDQKVHANTLGFKPK